VLNPDIPGTGEVLVGDRPVASDSASGGPDEKASEGFEANVLDQAGVTLVDSLFDAWEADRPARLGEGAESD
jgi:protocatechuate 3,4-dioxygenase beta subunit